MGIKIRIGPKYNGITSNLARPGHGFFPVVLVDALVLQAEKDKLAIDCNLT